jgi:hypothetical protein
LAGTSTDGRQVLTDSRAVIRAARVLLNAELGTGKGEGQGREVNGRALGLVHAPKDSFTQKLSSGRRGRSMRAGGGPGTKEDTKMSEPKFRCAACGTQIATEKIESMLSPRPENQRFVRSLPAQRANGQMALVYAYLCEDDMKMSDDDFANLIVALNPGAHKIG